MNHADINGHMTLFNLLQMWKHFFARRWRQVEGIPISTERYKGWVQTIGAGMVTPNFTENGWGLTRASIKLVQTFKNALYNGFFTAQLEHVVDVIEGSVPFFIPIGSLVKETLDILKPYHEAWSNQALAPSHAYG